MPTTIPYNLKKGTQISVEAEQDRDLIDCFVDIGYLDILLDCTNLQSILLGRTGSGKSALILQLNNKKKDSSLILNPESMLFDSIINSKITNDLLNLEVNLKPFFKLIWQHVFFLEFTTNYLNWVESEKNSKAFLDKITSYFNKDKSKENNLNKKLKSYYEKYIEKSKNLWNTTESKITEIIEMYNANVNAKFNIGEILSTDSNLGTTSTNNTQTKETIQNIISSELRTDLNSIGEFINCILKTNSIRKYYILIDKLDENWAPNQIRYLLIEALIETIKDLKKENFKLIIALREDLFLQVINNNKTTIQREKFSNFQIDVNWKKESIEYLLNKRIQKITNAEINNISSLLPQITSYDYSGKTKRLHSLEYIINRTLLRPRDAIDFFNCIFNKMNFKTGTKITKTIIIEAEKDYSNNRYRAIVDEWKDLYQWIDIARYFFDKLPAVFKFDEIKRERIEDWALLLLDFDKSDDFIFKAVKKFIDEKIDMKTLTIEILNLFFLIGFIGLKIPGEKNNFVYTNKNIRIDKTNMDKTTIFIHKMFWAKFKTNPKQD